MSAMRLSSQLHIPIRTTEIYGGMEWPNLHPTVISCRYAAASWNGMVRDIEYDLLGNAGIEEVVGCYVCVFT